MIVAVITCDECNPRARVKLTPEGSGFYEGSRRDALELGWRAYRDGSGYEKHRCPQCQEKGS